MNDANIYGLGEKLFTSLQKHGKKVAQFLADTDEVNTYSDLLTRSIRTAIKLKAQGIKRGDIVSTCTHNNKDNWIPFLASQFLGAISANFDENLSPLDTVHLLKLIKPRILFVSQNALEFMESCLCKANVNTQLVVFGDSQKYNTFSEYVEPCDEETTFYPVKVENENDIAVIIFSSGTTGLPKGICLHDKCLLNISKANLFKINNSEDKNVVVLFYSTLYWISCVFSLIKCVSNGYCYVICKKFDPANSWRLIEKYKVTAKFLPPYDAIEFLKSRPKNVDVSSLEIFYTGSCPVNKQLMEDLIVALPQTKILNCYGCSETGGVAASFDSTLVAEYKMQLLKPTSCGKICSDLKWKVVDTTSENILGPNEEGEIRVKADTIMKGYYKMDSSSAFDSDGYLRTGDLGYYDEDECFYIIGRIKEIFKYRGWHIVPTIIEDVLTSHPAVREAAVIGVPHEIDGNHPMGIVVLNNGYDNINTDTIVNFVNERVSESQKLRAGVAIVTNIPKTTTGKIKRRALEEIASYKPIIVSNNIKQ
ncbi:unnamed protein product [Psylliodes chrysocephalus]|uniref:Luciferin 4-monooxygenase n=1 Tax=Psylliodes chrysocephalus TaxID=3402493 RepID=A0A9P0GC16_9CUCU|nr:unnamed protein product [Psylliodes chrysocephala]